MSSSNNRPCLSAYIMISTLFFGFAVGFSMGYVASEKGYFYSNSVVQNVQNVNMDDLDNGKNDSIVTTSSASSASSIETSVWEFLDNIFHNLPVSEEDQQQIEEQNTEHHPQDKQQQQQQQHTNLLRFPFQSSPAAPRPLIYLNRIDAYSLLTDPMTGTMSRYASDFFLISSGMDAQVNQAYSGVATAVAIINSLRFFKNINTDGVDIPVDKVNLPYPHVTQHDIFNDCTSKKVISHVGGGPGVDGILSPPYGLSMPQIADVLRCHLNATTPSGVEWSVQEQYGDKSHVTAGKMRFEIKNALSDPNSRVLVNYDRSAIGQVGGGHWSPVGSYSDKQDAFLILDVAEYKNPPVWIPTERLFEGLATYDECGSWNFPDGQDLLSQEERTAHTKEAYAAVTKKLGCKEELRGYIIVTRT
jgi:hypothetical protein